jgi:signal transduction histidine kinase
LLLSQRKAISDALSQTASEWIPRTLSFKTLSDRLADLLIRDNKKNWLAISVVVFLILSPVIFLGTLTYLKTHKDSTAFALAQRQAIAYLAAATLREKLDRLIDLSASLASRVRFRKLISEGKWHEAVEILSSVPKDFPFIDRVFLAGLDGTLWADTPALPNVRGKNFADRDWYRGVSQDWKPYVSEVYRRAAEPRYNVVAIAAPIKAEDGDLVGILVLQVKLDFLLEWTNAITVGPNGFVVIIDKRGKIAAHPKFPPQGELIDYSEVPAAQKLLGGTHGVELLFNPFARQEQVVAYQPVSGYGWGAIVEQSTADVFAVRDESFNRLLAAYALIGFFSCVLAYLIIRFVTDRRQAENEIQNLNRDLTQRSLEAEAANKELEAFSYSVSHDLRAPLRAIDGFSRILLDEHALSLSAEERRLLSLVRENALNMGQLIDDLLAFSRLSRQPLKKQNVGMGSLARQVYEELKTQQNGRRVEISFADLPDCQGDPTLLKQVFVNLLSNALKYTRKCDLTRIELGCDRESGEAAFFIKDNGAGFDMRYADKLFRVFQRLHRAEDYEGTGVGLAIVQRVIHRHGGRVWAQGELNKGATFYFTVGAVNESK